MTTPPIPPLQLTLQALWENPLDFAKEVVQKICNLALLIFKVAFSLLSFAINPTIAVVSSVLGFVLYNNPTAIEYIDDLYNFYAKAPLIASGMTVIACIVNITAVATLYSIIVPFYLGQEFREFARKANTAGETPQMPDGGENA